MTLASSAASALPIRKKLNAEIQALFELLAVAIIWILNSGIFENMDGVRGILAP